MDPENRITKLRSYQTEVMPAPQHRELLDRIETEGH
jgi:hypothetical protein